MNIRHEIALSITNVKKSVPINIEEKSGKNAIDIKADKEEILNINAVTNQVKEIKTPMKGWKAKTTPIAVATPFPPLNFNQRGNM